MSSYKEILNNSSNTFAEKEQLEILKTCLLECYKEIDVVCRKYNIKLMAIGGTLLGLVRHQGFIPWDDDLDLALSREDYDKFIDIYNKELKERYDISVPKKTYNAGNRFIQLYKKNTYLEKNFYEIHSEPKMISVDIFPIDYVPDNKVLYWIKGIHSNSLMAIASCVQIREDGTSELKQVMKASFKGKILLSIRSIIGFIFSYKNSRSWFYKVDKVISINRKTKNATIAVGRNHYFGETIEASAFYPLRKGSFEGLEMYMPNNPDRYLKNLYGDNYMQLPPIEKRESHNIKKIEVLGQSGGY
jgi:lipopolysaccharide cholinephosphotransferase